VKETIRADGRVYRISTCGSGVETALVAGKLNDRRDIGVTEVEEAIIAWARIMSLLLPDDHDYSRLRKSKRFKEVSSRRSNLMQTSSQLTQEVYVGRVWDVPIIEPDGLQFPICQLAVTIGIEFEYL
jgi:hypothetical protein